MDQSNCYNDFISYLNENIAKTQELMEKMTLMLNETTQILLETCTLFHPQILIELDELDKNGRKYDDYILKGQELKTNLSLMTSSPHKNVEDFQQIMEEIKLLDSELDMQKESYE